MSLCPECEGLGELIIRRVRPHQQSLSRLPCRLCQGSGYVINKQDKTASPESQVLSGTYAIKRLYAF